VKTEDWNVLTGMPEPRGQRGQLPPALVARGQRGGRDVPFCDVTRPIRQTWSFVHLHIVN